MKILLVAINAKYIHSNLAVHSLRASAAPYQNCIEIAEYTINQRKEEILRDIYLRKPDLLCFSVYLWNLEYVEAIQREFHKLCPKVPIWEGGPEVSFETKEYLEKKAEVTGVMIGEGEDTFRELCAHYAGEELLLSEINGIAYREDGGEIRFTRPRETKCLSDVPFCYDNLEEYANRIIYYESSRGCPFSCSYCLSSVDKKLRFRDLEHVKKELQFFIDQRVPQVKFVDRTFNCDHGRTLAIWSYLTEHDQGVTNFHFEVSADLLNEEELELISKMRPGLIQLEIGVQSTNEVTIKEIHRTMKLERVKEVVSRIRKGGNVHQHLDLIAGLPFEDYQSFRRSFDEIYALWPNQLQLGFLKVLKGSFLYENAKSYGLVWKDEPPYEVLYTKWLSFEEVLKIKLVEEMLEVYYNSGQFEVTMKLIYALTDSAFDLFLELGEYYEEKGYAGIQHSRIRRCEILLDFLRGKGIPTETIQESLTYDLYARENCKTRPAWAPDLSEYKEMTRKYCANGKLSHLEPFHYLFPGKESVGLKALPKRLEHPSCVLFHYEERNPLDHQARTEVLSE